MTTIYQNLNDYTQDDFLQFVKDLWGRIHQLKMNIMLGFVTSKCVFRTLPHQCTQHLTTTLP